ncbi:BTAD domain-containing putative transcriptional regulator [Actinomadura rugatobispora]|uniref:BTAD domain-containing putative transcriptional regulator n=1 Tax=Actinomadura rugatobispora TaxID=1994 RepID=A0ABW1A467_9ACTN|nr:BTAD domain-containing putative transcriptional regulator [Actinomadura rugatobispora]
MRFGVLGPVEVCRDGRAVAVGGPRVRALLAMLLLDAGNVVGTERLIDGLYGEEPPAGAANALQSQVSRLRRGLGDADLVEGHPAGYRLAVRREDVDVHRFERLVAEARGDAAVLREALGLWRGPALAGLAAPFAAAQAARLEESRAGAVEACAEAEIAAGDFAGPLRDLPELIAAHPLRERARGLLMRALHASGRQAEALEFYEETRRLLAAELGADPSGELAEIHLAILRGEGGGARAATALPAQLTSFVGREAELRRVGKMLAEWRLVTLLGPGGAGKTRLALEAAGREEGEVCFVDLSPVGDGAEVPKAVLGALGLREGAIRPGGRHTEELERLVAALGGRRMLIVLDNCEHVIDAAARLAHRLLGALPALRVLATSREALGVTGEALRPLPPLELPPGGAAAAEAATYPAVRLFADRAAAVRPGFAVTPGNAGAVAHICAALDGLPLAIELAAARLRSLPVEEVARRLDDRFRLLSRGDRSAAPRHQTLRAVVEWSWDLLDDAERTLARRLTVFAGGATLEAAERVCAMDADVDDLLAGLVEKSLLQTDGTRYRMLSTVHAFCAEWLAEAGEEERFGRAHTAYFLDFARHADPRLRGAGQLEWLALLAADHGNLHAALRRAVRSDRGTALRLVAALSWYWWLRGRIEGGPLSIELLEAVGVEPPEGFDEEYILCVTNAISAGVSGPAATAALDLATEKMAALRWQVAYPPTLVMWALTAGPQRTDVDTRVLRKGWGAWSRALLDMSESFLAQYRGDIDDAEMFSLRALEGFRALGDRWGMANSLDPLAQIADQRGDRARAVELLDEALELAGEIGALEDQADLLCRRAALLVNGGDPGTARTDYERAGELARRAGAPDKVATAHHGLAELARLRGDVDEARRLYDEALAGVHAERFITVATRAAVLTGLGWIALADGHAAGARAWMRQALELTFDHPVFTHQAQAIVGMAAVVLLEGDAPRAGLLVGAAAAVRGASLHGDPDLARIEAGAREALGDAAYEAARSRGAALTAEEAVRTALGS